MVGGGNLVFFMPPGSGGSIYPYLSLGLRSSVCKIEMTLTSSVCKIKKYISKEMLTQCYAPTFIFPFFFIGSLLV